MEKFYVNLNELPVCAVGLLAATFVDSDSSMTALVIVVVLLGSGFGVFSSPT